MTQTTKRILALLMAIAMLFAVVGCGGDDADNNSSATDTTPSTETNDDVEYKSYFKELINKIF